MPALAEAVKHDPVAFTERLLTHPDGSKIIPHAGQVEVMSHIARDTTLVTGRQWGKSVSLAWYAVWFSVTHAHRDIYIIAPTVDQARIIFNEIAAHFRKVPLDALVKGKITDYPFPKIRLENGSEIHARGANSPQFIRGKRAHLIILDEAAFIKDSTITDVIEPMMTVTGKEPDSALIKTSSPFGQGYFKESYELGRKRMDQTYRAFHYTSADNPHADRAYLERVKERYGEDSLLWRTEYMGQFADSDLAVFPWADIKWSYEHFAERYHFPMGYQEGHRYVQGVDLANMRDFFVASVLDITDPLSVPLARMDRHQQKGYPFYKDLIRSNVAAYRHVETILDATSLGQSVEQDLADIGAEGYKIGSNQAKYDIVHELKRMLSEHRLLIPYDRTTVDELRFFQYKVTAAKVTRMEAVRGHDDVVMSLSLAAHKALLPHEIGLFQAVSLTPSPPEPDPPGYDPFAELFKFDE